MAAKSTRADKARQAAQSAGSNPYVRRMIEDAELRNSVKDAFEAARHAYKRMSNGKGPVKAVTEDKKVQRDLRSAAGSLRDASERLRGKTKKRHPLRKLFGAEEEFEYSSQTTPAPEPTATE